MSRKLPTVTASRPKGFTSFTGIHSDFTFEDASTRACASAPKNRVSYESAMLMLTIHPLEGRLIVPLCRRRMSCDTAPQGDGLAESGPENRLCSIARARAYRYMRSDTKRRTTWRFHNCNLGHKMIPGDS